MFRHQGAILRESQSASNDLLNQLMVS